MNNTPQQNNEFWTPRWYYILRNKTSKKRYVGQHNNDDVGIQYFGSGLYWINHCKKHGGHNSDNIETVDQVYITEKHEADKWLADLESREGIYWLREDWGNKCRENSESTPLIGGEIQRKSNKRRIEDGTHNLLGKNNSIHRRTANGENPFSGPELSSKRIADGTHNLLGDKNPVHERIRNGTHHLLGEKNPSNTKFRCAVTGFETNRGNFARKAKRMGLEKWPHPLERIT